MNRLGCSDRNASKKALIKAKRRTQQQTKLKEVEEKVTVGEEKIFARWRSSTATIMAMLNAEDFPDQKRKEDTRKEERQIQKKKMQNEEALRAELDAKQVEVHKKAIAEKKRIKIRKQEVAYDTMTRYCQNTSTSLLQYCLKKSRKHH